MFLYRYFTAAYPTSIERNIFYAQISTISTEQKETPSEPVALTDSRQPSYYKADFSPFAGFYLLSYQGPSVPWQKVMKVGDKGACWRALQIDYVLTPLLSVFVP